MDIKFTNDTKGQTIHSICDALNKEKENIKKNNYCVNDIDNSIASSDVIAVACISEKYTPLILLCLDSDGKLDLEGAVQEYLLYFLHYDKSGAKLNPNKLLSNINRTQKNKGYNKKEFCFVATLNLKKNEPLPKELNLINDKILFNENIPINIREKICIDDDYSTVSIYLNAISEEEAYFKGLNILDCIRGLLNLPTYIISKFMPSNGNFFETPYIPINEVLSGKNYYLYEINKEIKTYCNHNYNKEYFGFADYSKYNKINLKTVLNTAFSKFITYINNNNSLLRHEVKNNLVLLCRANDIWDYDQSFLVLWSILENSTFKETEKQHTLIPKRIARITDNPEISKGILDIARVLRNRITHQGISEYFAINLGYSLNDIIVQVLMYMINNSDKFDNKDDYLAHFDCNDDL